MLFFMIFNLEVPSIDLYSLDNLILLNSHHDKKS